MKPAFSARHRVACGAGKMTRTAGGPWASLVPSSPSVPRAFHVSVLSLTFLLVLVKAAFLSFR